MINNQILLYALGRLKSIVTSFFPILPAHQAAQSPSSPTRTGSDCRPSGTGGVSKPHWWWGGQPVVKTLQWVPVSCVKFLIPLTLISYNSPSGFAFLTIRTASNKSDCPTVFWLGASWPLLMQALVCMDTLHMVIQLRGHSHFHLVLYYSLLFFNLNL